MTFREIFERILEEVSDEEQITVREAIARGITQKACGGDITAVKFLREVCDGEGSDAISEIRISVIDGGNDE